MSNLFMIHTLAGSTNLHVLNTKQIIDSTFFVFPDKRNGNLNLCFHIADNREMSPTCRETTISGRSSS